MRPRSTCHAARRKRHFLRSMEPCRTTPTLWSAVIRSEAGSRASPRPSPTPPTRRSCCSATRSIRPAAPERAAARIEHWPRIRCPVLLLSGESDPFARIGLLRDGVRQLPARRARHVSEAGAHAQAGPRRRARSGGGVPARRRRPHLTAQIVTALTCRGRQMSLSFAPLNSTRSCAPNAAQPVPPVQGRLPRPLPVRRSTTDALSAPEEGRSRIATP